MGKRKLDSSGWLQAAALFAKGVTQAEVAHRLGESRTSTMHWYDGNRPARHALHRRRPFASGFADLLTPTA